MIEQILEVGPTYVGDAVTLALRSMTEMTVKRIGTTLIVHGPRYVAADAKELASAARREIKNRGLTRMGREWKINFAIRVITQGLRNGKANAFPAFFLFNEVLSVITLRPFVKKLDYL